MHKPVLLQNAIQHAHLPTLPSQEISSRSENPDPPQPLCNLCGGVGYVRNDIQDIHSPAFGKLIRCSCKAAEDATRMQLSIGTILTHFSLADIQTAGRPGTTRMVSAVREFLVDPTGWLTIWGCNGTGKSMAGQALVGELLDKNIPALYMTTKMAVDYLKRGITDSDFNVADRLVQLTNISVLVLDEMAVQVWTAWASEQLETLLDMRQAAGFGGTVLILDVDPVSFLSSRVISRMDEGHIVHNADPDMRKSIGQAKEYPCA